MLKPDLDMPDEAVTVDAVKRALIIAGSPRRVLDQLVALREENRTLRDAPDGRA